MTDPRLIQAVQELDPGTRALLDLSLRRAIPDERVAGLLGVELAEIPRRRARGIAELADKLAVPGPAELAMLLVAIPELPEEAWGVPNPKLPKAKRVSAARRAKAFRRAAVAASPLVAAAAVLAAVIVSSGGGGQKSANLTLTGRAAAGGTHQPAAVAKAPAKADARHALPRGAEVASAEGPSPATITARKAAAARHRRQRARHRQHHTPAVNTIPVSDNFATSAPQPDAYVPPPKPKHKHKPHPNKPKDNTQPETPTTTTPQTPTTPTPQVVATPPTQQVTTTTPDITPPKQESYKKPPMPVVPVPTPPQTSSDDNDDDNNSGDNGGGGCGHHGGAHKLGGNHNWQGGQKSSVFKTRRELNRQRNGWSQD
jgi:hypothetical protein